MRFLCQLTVSFITGLALCNAAFSQPRLDPALSYQGKKSDPVTYDVDFAAVVTPPYHTKSLKIWLPLPQSDAGQTVEAGTLESFPMKVPPKIAIEKAHGNQFAYFEFDHPEGAQMIRHRFKITVWEMRWNIDPKKVEAVGRWPAVFDSYLRSDSSVTVDDRFRKIVDAIVPMKKGAGNDLGDVMRWVNGYMKYDHVNASLSASAEHALLKKVGHCSDYHGLCAALGRALGYPTRVAYGINPFPKNSPSHCKFEAFIPPYGWVFFDVSETQRVIESIQKDGALEPAKKEQLVKLATERLLSGFRDNTWFLQTKGTDYDLVPPAKKRVSVVRTIYAEADGEALREPDPANAKQREFSWMTMHHYMPSRKVEYPFNGWKSLVANP